MQACAMLYQLPAHSADLAASQHSSALPHHCLNTLQTSYVCRRPSCGSQSGTSPLSMAGAPEAGACRPPRAAGAASDES